jgi:hypothetical protein
VYLASDVSTQEASARATGWVDAAYLSIPGDQMVGLILENEKGRLEFEKDGDAWMMKGLTGDETLDSGSVTTLVNRAGQISMLQPLGKEEKEEYGLQEPNAVVTIRTHSDEAGDRTYALRVGAESQEDNGYFVISSESDYYVQVSEFAVRDFVEKGREDFLTPPATPVPEVEPEATTDSP